MPGDITQLDPIDVMYVRECEKPDEEAFAELEAVVGLKGRRFYGVFDEDAGRYWACVQRRDQDDPASLGLRTCTVGGGLNAYERLRGNHDELVALIAPTFEAMAARCTASIYQGPPSSSIVGTTNSRFTFLLLNHRLAMGPRGKCRQDCSWRDRWRP